MEIDSSGQSSRVTRSSPRLASFHSKVLLGSAKTESKFWENQDVLARWTDGLLYLGTIKKVDKLKEMCLICFEDDSEFWVLWKDIHSSVVPETQNLCSICREEATCENRLVHCDKCKHGFHQECHVPRIELDTVREERAWTCRHCVFAVATKRGGALKKGPCARAMQAMKTVLPYQLADLEWDPLHLTNQQQCYCYCGGPGNWNLKMLQCRLCGQWFHEACTQCLPKPLLYGDRFYLFECSVCTGGSERVKRHQLTWVDVAHLLLYHLSICCKKKYFDFDREILPFVNENWDNLLLGRLSATPKSERCDQLLNILNLHKTRFVSGREIKKKKCLFGLQNRVPPPPPSSLPATVLDCWEPVMEPLTNQEPRLQHTAQRSSLLRQRGSSDLKPKKKWRTRRSLEERRELRSRHARKLFQRAVTEDVVNNPTSVNQCYSGFAGNTCMYNFRRTDSRCLESSPPRRMFASFHPSACSAGQAVASSSSSSEYSEILVNRRLAAAPGFLLKQENAVSISQYPSTRSKAPSHLNQSECSYAIPTPSAVSHCTDAKQLWREGPLPLQAPASSYFGPTGRLARGEAVRILARRVTLDGTVQYLVEWGGANIF
ncbi:PHD finger protein 1 [Latimeria chalumnae]|uniref:PHD finger protein 1 n=1 Tax=Latimeria chalumnae TaxID=7897 RepID=UPI0003C16394|nr:PREDICTED: PHD finger protein 1 isoform X2 [Latimeria chalumnae]XP_006000996.1 PREDICTED: PHD finger protein 1 isoform X2 [Latimeria chalumnae]|eukprot:XP_006000995.1 PREDICTED: PHD finger protein 1 isoform X2 [Latimeria chalumnae]